MYQSNPTNGLDPDDKKDFVRFSVLLNAPRAPIRDVWPVHDPNGSPPDPYETTGIVPITGTLNDTTPFYDNYVTSVQNPPADQGKYRVAMVTKAVWRGIVRVADCRAAKGGEVCVGPVQ